MNRVFHDNTAESAYSTLFFAQYDDAAPRLRYVNCGHLPAMLLRRDNPVETLDSTSTVLGLFRRWDCTTAERHLFPGDLLALYTYGVSESFNDAEEDFGEQRLIEALRRSRELSASALIASVVSEVQQFCSREQHDDITMIVAKVT